MNMIRAYREPWALAFIAVCVALAALVGCGRNANKTKLTGKVDYKGAPVTGGTIRLTNSSVAPAYRIYIHDDGTFATDDAPVGIMEVAIETDSAAPGPPGPGHRRTSPRKQVVIPARYNNPKTSGLTWDTKTEKTKNFDLTD